MLDGLDYRSAKLTNTKIWQGDANNRPSEVDMPAAVMSSKVKFESRDMTAESGDVSYTGYGFQPRVLVGFAVSTLLEAVSWGICDSASTAYNVRRSHLSEFSLGVNFISIETAGAQRQTATVKSLDADGFTLTWTKIGSPTETTNIIMLALK